MKPKRAQCSFAFFYKERKRTQRTFRSFIQNRKERKERKERRVLLLRTKKTQRMPRSFIMNGKEPRTLRSFEKNRCPTLVKNNDKNISVVVCKHYSKFEKILRNTAKLIQPFYCKSGPQVSRFMIETGEKQSCDIVSLKGP